MNQYTPAASPPVRDEGFEIVICEDELLVRVAEAPVRSQTTPATVSVPETVPDRLLKAPREIVIVNGPPGPSNVLV